MCFRQDLYYKTSSEKASKLLLESLGFVVNQDKLNLIPSKRIRKIGFVVDSEHMAASLPEGKTFCVQKYSMVKGKHHFHSQVLETIFNLLV